MNIIQTSIPPLVAGDKLTLKEFLRRWEAMPEVKRAELIDGVVYMPSPVGFDQGDVEMIVAVWIAVYAASTPGCKGGTNTTTILGGSSAQPDVQLRLLPEVGGRTRPWRKLVQGAPELTAEVCVSSASYDLNQKLMLYQKGKVYEYLAVLMHEQDIRWHRLVRGRYRLVPPGQDGIYRSDRFPGLWLDGAALLAQNTAAVLATLEIGLKSPEHIAFVERLERRRSS